MTVTSTVPTPTPSPSTGHGKTAFVTGSTGFLGITLIEELLLDGWHILAMHRPRSDLSDLRALTLPSGTSLNYVVGDITDVDSLRRAIPQCVDAVFHAAGSVEVLPHAQETSRYAVNQGGTRNMVQVCLEKQIGRFIHTSTVLTQDLTLGRVNEFTPPHNNLPDHYIRSKRLAEVEVERGMRDGLDAVILSPSAIFGAYDKATWSTVFTEVYRGLPTPFMAPGALSAAHMRKVAQAHVSAHHRGRGGHRYILGGPDVTLMEITQAVAAILQRPGPRWVIPAWLFKTYAFFEHNLSLMLGRQPTFTPHIADTLCYVGYSDSSKAIRELGYDPSSLDEMLRDCYHWMLQTGRLPAPKSST